MNTRLALSLSLIGGVTAMAFWLKPSNPMRADGSGFGSSMFWTIRSRLWNYPLALNGGLEQWDTGDPSDDESLTRELTRTNRIWLFLRPFFTSRGYDLYAMEDEKNCFSSTLPSPSASKPSAESSYPFPRSYVKDNRDCKFRFKSPRVWAARDRNGRDVVIKVVSGPNTSNDLQALRLLTSYPLARDPRNHTIPILEFLEFSGLVFIVMPRWSTVFAADFATVGEIVRYGHAFFEAVAFLHEHDIAHGDILIQNMVMDVYLPENAPQYAGLHGPERRYAFIDFETAQLSLPTFDSTPGEMKTKSEHLHHALKGDIRRIATQLQVTLRCIEDVLPGIVPLLDDMKSPNHLTAGSCLARYEKLCSLLTPDDLRRMPQAIRFDGGKFRYREAPPLYIEC